MPSIIHQQMNTQLATCLWKPHAMHAKAVDLLSDTESKGHSSLLKVVSSLEDNPNLVRAL